MTNLFTAKQLFVRRAPLWMCAAALGILASAPSRAADPLMSEVFASDLPVEEQAPATVVAAGNSAVVTAATHGRGCPCAGCRAFYEACEVPCPPGMAPQVTPDMLGGELLPEGGAPEGELVAPAQQPPMSGPMPSVSSGLDLVAAGSTASPGMIGDFFGGGYQYETDGPFDGATVAVAGGDRVMKFADNNNPIPQDRFFFNYHLFSNPVVDINGQNQDVNRFTFGLEKTFFQGTTSLEFRVPFAAGVSNVQSVSQTTDTVAAEFGNLALAAKVLLYQRGPWSISGGLGVIFPTAEDAAITDDGEPIVNFANESLFLQPFLGVYCRPTCNLFTQFVAQTNFDVSGSTVSIAGDNIFSLPGGSDVVYEQSLLFLDYSMGYWLYRTKRCDTWLTGIAPMIELHYASTMEDLDLPDIGGETLFEPDFRRDALNVTGGVLLGLGQWTSLRVAGVAPLRDESLMYDAEFGVQLIRRY